MPIKSFKKVMLLKKDKKALTNFLFGDKITSVI